MESEADMSASRQNQDCMQIKASILHASVTVAALKMKKCVLSRFVQVQQGKVR